jgi:octaprenyl-diphosphate synthase
VAFQIADDVLDLVGEERTAGKSLGTDLEQQKLTLPLVRLLSGRGEASSKVEQVLQAPGNHKRAALAPYLRSSDAIEYARGRADEYAARARGELECLPPSECRGILEYLTERVVRRDA